MEGEDQRYNLREFDPSRPKRRRQAPAVQVVEQKAVIADVPTPSTEGIEKDAWLKDDVATGKERDYTYALEFSLYPRQLRIYYCIAAFSLVQLYVRPKGVTIRFFTFRFFSAESRLIDSLSYVELLKRIYDVIMDSGRGESADRRSIEPPKVALVGTRRVCWLNFGPNCRAINRPPQHVTDFVLTELGTTGDLGENDKLTMRGRFQGKQFENVLKKYISEYVTCKTCKSPDTVLKKENRLVFKVCQTCGSSSSVASIQTGFRATTAADRRAERQAVH